jgi:hypothetical protein
MKNVFYLFFSSIKFYTERYITTSSTKEFFRVVYNTGSTSSSHTKMRASHIQWIDRQWKSWSIRELVIVYVQLFFFFFLFILNSDSRVLCIHDNPRQTWNSLWIKHLSLSFAITQLILHGYTIAEVITLEFFLFYNWEKTTTSFDITDGGCCCCCCAPSSIMENFYREFILLDLQHIILGHRSIERTGERLLQGLCNQQSGCSLIYRVRKRRTEK